MSLLLVFDSHPVQYRVPVWQAMERLASGSVHVAYASDCSVNGHDDVGFRLTIAWDEPLLHGYAHTVLHAEHGPPLTGWSSLTGKGISALIDKLNPTAILLTGLNYRFDWCAYREARRRGIPLWLRCETQDHAVTRGRSKSWVRSILYRVAYRGFERCFYIGNLNRAHYRRHGVPENRLQPARYGTVDRFADLDQPAKTELRKGALESAGIMRDALVIGFSGKFISKKNPDILFEMLPHLPSSLRSRVWLYFLGSGEREPELRQAAEKAVTAGRLQGVTFAGFANQSQLAGHYAAMDVLVLPSRRMGETWGLVVNEAMQAGCAVVVSDAVGSGEDFKGWERFRVFPGTDAGALASQVGELAELPRDFCWARHALIPYNLEATAHALIAALQKSS